MSMFDELLAIKRFREGQAEIAVARQRQVLQDARDGEQAALRSLDDFRGWADAHERELYGDLCRRTVRVREIESVLQDVAGLREGERQHEQALDAARAAAEREESALQARRDDHRQATRMSEKFVELARSHFDAQLREAERKEDLEMEEAASVARDRDDWEQHEEYEPS
ncbi:type III secretion protein [Bordetella genomosp. 1]|uniref:Type III secretion protein n=1 Tax=Bordetella genomosp. 1 TaxID=1395607 RepID=A0A261S6T8_9BORD|nr:YscO family type III secretion system apparatus protein [Bordetella genomosp. 1]OZI33078.1 type III secretion protein [Bordetella genomosp. 1]OZI57182.1 type III secretion protein [Bordetella genomosp. 1]